MNIVEIRDYLTSRGLKYKWLANQIGISESYMSLLISGKRNWNQNFIEKTADVLDIQTDRLLQMINQNIINNRENNGKYI
jgi:antitoxin component HigA of HigAB toxin-antitoxin module|tara:strand:- start:135 stop:374 length:240 start_codon:yes stop_codon:yes gene_type:complete